MNPLQPYRASGKLSVLSTLSKEQDNAKDFTLQVLPSYREAATHGTNTEGICMSSKESGLIDWQLDADLNGWQMPKATRFNRLPVIRHARAIYCAYHVQKQEEAVRRLGMIPSGYDRWVIHGMFRGKERPETEAPLLNQALAALIIFLLTALVIAAFLLMKEA